MGIKVRKGNQWVPVSGGGGESIGVILAWGGSSGNVPSGYLLCDGRPISRDYYSDLFSTIGVTHGSGDEVNTFNLPNLEDKFIVGASDSTGDSTYPGVSPGSTGGSANAVLLSHTHTQTGGGGDDDGGSNVPGSNSGGTQSNISNIGIDNSGTTQTDGSVSGTNANLPPYYALCYIIKVFNTRADITNSPANTITVQNNGSQVSSNAGIINFTTGLKASGSGSNITVSTTGEISTTTQSTSIPLATADFGKLKYSTGSADTKFTVPVNVFSPGNFVSFYNQSTNIHNISPDTNVTIFLSGSNVSVTNPNSVKLSPRALATLTCIVGGASPQFVISGGGVYI